MFLTTPQIVWHNKEPIFSVDFHYSDQIWRLASSGADHTVKIWKVVREDVKIKLIFLSNLDRHTKSVNVVRFSPNGEFLASGGDDCTICIWQLNTSDNDVEIVSMETTNSEANKENWTIHKMLRGHLEDIYDLCWSNSIHLISGSVDNTAIVWNVSTGDKLAILKESHHYIQGVAWDPSGGCLATLGTDRTLRIYRTTKDKFKCVHSIDKFNDLEGLKSTRMFHDETISSFFRRLTFSPDGNILVAPGGKVEFTDQTINVTWIFSKSSFPKPVLYLPAPDKPSIVVRFCPVLFELHHNDIIDSVQPLIDLPYRMIFAVVTLNKVLLYDTYQATPIGYIADIHYTSLTDATWSKDGLLLAISSSDGYCTIIGFDENELGTPLVEEKHPQSSPVLNIVQSPSCEDTPTSHQTPTVTPSVTPSRRITPIPVDKPITTLSTPPHIKEPTKPRRVNFITLSSPQTNDKGDS